MTHDELVRFAASKVGVEVEAVKTKRYFDPTYPDGSTIATASFLFEEIISHYAIKGTRKRFDLTSPELMLKGMGVLPDYISWDIDGDKSEQYVNLVDLRKGDTNAARFWKTPKEIPLLFWQCWAELEGGQG